MYYTASGIITPIGGRPVLYTTCCKHILVLLGMGEIISRNILRLLTINNIISIVASNQLFVKLFDVVHSEQRDTIIFL